MGLVNDGNFCYNKEKYMNKHSSTSLIAGALVLVSVTAVAALFTSGSIGQVSNSQCVGMPYGTAGCPLKASSSSSVALLTCGNGYLEAGEECDLGQTKNGFSNCTKQCKLLFCGDGLISPATKEECEPESEEVYALDPATGELIIEVRYLAPTCGAICTVPTCDAQGNCSGGCKRNFLPACTNSSSSAATQLAQNTSSASSTGAVVAPVPASSTPAVATTPVSVCGNGVIDGGEQCDDGNTINEDACTNACRIAICGDQVVQLWEQCDDGNRIDADACSNTCKSPACGDGVMQNGEECDDGNQSNQDSCTNSCKLPRCGDLLIQQNEDCDDGNMVNSDSCSNECKAPRCGDAILQTGEECDDGNQSDTDACTTKCILPRCGDGVIQQAEECDDANKINADGCNNLCKLPFCGNGLREGEEICDDGNQSNNDACSNECTRPMCGDGFVQPGEFCDDGNQNNDDNCTTACRVPTCGDGLLHPREECDDGRSNSDTKPSACRMNCRAPRCGDAVTDEGEECDGGEECSPECTLLKSAAPILTDEDGGISLWIYFAITLAGLGTVAVLAFVMRKQLHQLVARVAGESAAEAIDNIPLDQIEMPWQKW